MGYVYQSCPWADTNKYSASLWVYIRKSDVTGFGLVAPLLQFGPRDGDYAQFSSSAWSYAPVTVFSGLALDIPFGGSSGTLYFLGAGRYGGANGLADAATDASVPGIPWFRVTQGPGANVRMDQWNHIAYSVRINAEAAVTSGANPSGGAMTYTVTSSSDLVCTVNAVDCSPANLTSSNVSRLSVDIGMFGQAPLHGNLWNDNGSKRILSAVSTFEHGVNNSYTNDVGPDNGGVDVPAAHSIGQWNQAFNGLAFGLPSTNGLAAPNNYDEYPDGTPTIKTIYGDVQFWAGQYIDWTDATNFSKVVSISGGRGTPQKPSVAAAAFGKQNVVLLGNKTQFYNNNNGSSGAFTRVGTSSDFTPTPGY